MRVRKFGIVALLALAGMGAGVQITGVAAADADSYAGAWKGEWEGGGGSGRFDLTFVSGGDGKLGATASVGSDTGDYNATFSTVTFAGNKLAGAYDFTPDPKGEVTIVGSFDLKTAAGTWSLGAKGAPSPAMASGTWKVSKQ
jgi:hypothetical protein